MHICVREGKKNCGVTVVGSVGNYGTYLVLMISPYLSGGSLVFPVSRLVDEW